MTDPNVRTGPGGEEIVLEPGDEGYVDLNGPSLSVPGPMPAPEPTIANPPTTDPSLPPSGDGPDGPPTSGVFSDPALPVQQEGEVVPEPQDLRLVNEAGQSESEAIIHARGLVVDSQSAGDLVPNTPQITMGVRVPVETPAGLNIGEQQLYVGVPAEVVIAEEAQALATEAEVEDEDVAADTTADAEADEARRREEEADAERTKAL